MTPTILVILFATGAVALLVVGYSITYFFRGRHIQRDVGDNDNMRRLGLECTSQQIRRDEAALRGEPLSEIPVGCTQGDCADCAENQKNNC